MSSIGIPTSNIPKPGAIAVPNGASRALVVASQLLTPQFYKFYTEKFGSENFSEWLATFSGMEEVKNREFFWFQNRGRNQLAVTSVNAVVTPAAGATVTVTISAEDHFDSGTASPLRVGETVRVASSNIEGKILTVDTTTPNAFTCTIRPLRSSQAFVSAGSANLLANEVILLAGITEAGEASDSNLAQVHLDERKTNTITEIRESWSATDLAEMAEVFYQGGFSGSSPVGQAGTSLFTLKGLYKANERFSNNMEFKLIRGNEQNNTGLNNSVGTKGLIPQVEADATTINYNAGNLDIAKLHQITRSMDVQGCAKQNLWLMDIYQKQNFSDSIYKDLPAGAWVWGQGEKSQEASLAFGFESLMIDGFLFQTKKYKTFNTEAVYGKTPAVDYFRDYGLICPLGESRDARDASKAYKNITVMYQMPPKGGTIGNGIRVWRHGGGSENPTNGQMIDKVEMIAYRGLRVVAANQFVIVRG